VENVYPKPGTARGMHWSLRARRADAFTAIQPVPRPF